MIRFDFLLSYLKSIKEMKYKSALFLFSLFFFGSLQSQSLSDLMWLQGNWKGEAFGGVVRESWSPAEGDEMLGTFQLSKDGKNSILEFMAIYSEGDSITFFFNHFDQKLKRWEDEPIKLGMVESSKNHFKVLNFVEGKTAPRSLTYHFDEEKGKLTVVVEEWEKTSAGYESFSISYHKD